MAHFGEPYSRRRRPKRLNGQAPRHPETHRRIAIRRLEPRSRQPGASIALGRAFRYGSAPAAIVRARSTDRRGKRVMIGRGQREGVATEFLRDVLAGGALGVPKLEAMARTAGLLGEGQRITHAKVFKKAKKSLGIRSVRNGFGDAGEWLWRLERQPASPVSKPLAQPPPSIEDTYAEALEEVPPDVRARQRLRSVWRRK